MSFKHIFPGRSRTLSFNSQDFPGPKWFSRNFQVQKNNPGLLRRCGNPVDSLESFRAGIERQVKKAALILTPVWVPVWVQVSMYGLIFNPYGLHSHKCNVHSHSYKQKTRKSLAINAWQCPCWLSNIYGKRFTADVYWQLQENALLKFVSHKNGRPTVHTLRDAHCTT